MRKITTMIDDKTSETINRLLIARGWGVRKTGRLIDEAVGRLADWDESDQKKVEITRRSKLGWGWTTWTPERSSPPSRPDYTGTYRVVCEARAADRTLASMHSGGTYISTAWFIKTPAGWKRIITQDWESEFDYGNSVKVEITD